MKRSFAILAIACLLLVSNRLPDSIGIPELSFQAESKAWQIIYSFSEFRAEPGESVFVDFEISGLLESYDFTLNIVSNEELIIKGITSKNNYVTYSTLYNGDVFKERLEILVPNSVKYEEKFSLSIKVTSYDTKPGRFGRAAGPKYVYESKKDILLEIINHPKILCEIENQYTLGADGHFNLKIQNKGTYAANDLNIDVFFAEPIEIVEGNCTLYLSSLDSGETQVFSYILNATAGDYQVDITIESPDIPTEFQTQTVQFSQGIPGFSPTSIMIGLSLIFIFFIIAPRTRGNFS